MFLYNVFFFFKQKTAYEMRISDWSSDVCSSDLSSVVGRHHQLVRKGREFVALCPFHSDSKPSLNIVDEKGFYHCFACGAHGDVIRFVMESEGLGFMEAVEQLAAQAGLEVPKEDRKSTRLNSSH